MNTVQITLRLTDSEALVLFEFLTRFSNYDRLAVEHKAEARVLCDIQCLLESQIAAPFDANYSQLLDVARKQLID